MSKKYMITYRLNAGMHKRLNIWVENPITGYEDIETIEAYLNEYHHNLGDKLADVGCKIFAFSLYDLPKNADPFADNDSALYMGENDTHPEILNPVDNQKLNQKARPKLTLIRGNHTPKEDDSE